MTIVSYSEIFKIQTCVRQYYYNFTLNRRPITMSDAITTGVDGHGLLQSFYEFLQKGKTKQEAWDFVKNQVAMKMGKLHFTESGSLIKAWTLVDNYIRETEFPYKAVLVENRFLLPVAKLDTDPALSHVQIGFTPDLVLERPGGFLDVEDYKFVARAWSRSKANRYQQAKLYQIFLKRMGYNVSRSTLRWFNTTTAEITKRDYNLGIEEEKILIEDFIAGVRDVLRFKEQEPHLLKLAPRTMNYTACQYCQFENPCSLEAEGKDATKTLENQYTKGKYDYTK